jgi:hypothetical protein
MSQTTMDKVREEYLLWLEAQLKDEHSPKVRHWGLVNLMYDREFGWTVPHDDNRIADGMDLRIEFCNQSRWRRSQIERLGPCSFLEVLIGLSRRLAFIAGEEAPGWAWVLLTNLGLHKMTDPLTPRKENKIESIMDAVIQRTYSPDGQGGFFPLAWPDDDQTKIELWYQMNSYVEELHPEH